MISDLLNYRFANIIHISPKTTRVKKDHRNRRPRFSLNMVTRPRGETTRKKIKKIRGWLIIPQSSLKLIYFCDLRFIHKYILLMKMVVSPIFMPLLPRSTNIVSHTVFVFSWRISPTFSFLFKRSPWVDPKKIHFSGSFFLGDFQKCRSSRFRFSFF